MKIKVTTFVFLFLCLGFAVNSRADSDKNKVMVVDYEHMSKHVEDWAGDLIKDFQKLQMNEENKLKKAATKLEEAKKEAEDKMRIANEKGREEARSKVIDLAADFESLQKTIRVRMTEGAQKLEGKMDKRMVEAVKEEAKNKKAGLVLGRMPGENARILYFSKDDLDISNDVLKVLKKKVGSKEKEKDSKKSEPKEKKEKKISDNEKYEIEELEKRLLDEEN